MSKLEKIIKYTEVISLHLLLSGILSYTTFLLKNIELPMVIILIFGIGIFIIWWALKVMTLSSTLKTFLKKNLFWIITAITLSEVYLWTVLSTQFDKYQFYKGIVIFFIMFTIFDYGLNVMKENEEYFKSHIEPVAVLTED